MKLVSFGLVGSLVSVVVLSLVGCGVETDDGEEASQGASELESSASGAVNRPTPSTANTILKVTPPLSAVGHHPFKPSVSAAEDGNVILKVNPPGTPDPSSGDAPSATPDPSNGHKRCGGVNASSAAGVCDPGERCCRPVFGEPGFCMPAGQVCPG